ncbi:MAG: DUF4249 family protein [Bacteroidota bacterium]|nr:MAG: DUF4249 family protein [Bacteroidota bacterium]
MKHRIVVLVSGLILLAGCEAITDFYLGVPLQPKIEDNNYLPGLNVFGVIRPDQIDSINRSFLQVEEVAPAVGNYPEFTIDSLVVTDALVAVQDDSGNTISFSYSPVTSTDFSKRYRPIAYFQPQAGKIYALNCQSEGLPEIQASTRMPYPPKIIESSLLVDSYSVSFELSQDTTAFLYEAFLYCGTDLAGHALTEAMVGKNSIIHIELSQPNPDRLEVYAYDSNMASYILNSNTSFNLNKYRKAFGNLKNGYGVFGSLNFVLYTLP